MQLEQADGVCVENDGVKAFLAEINDTMEAEVSENFSLKTAKTYTKCDGIFQQSAVSGSSGVIETAGGNNSGGALVPINCFALLGLSIPRLLDIFYP